MVASKEIAMAINEIPENELIIANKLYVESFQRSITASAYYQALTRMCKSGTLKRIAKGTYYRPKKGVFGPVPPSEKEIVAAYTADDTGLVIGYSLYNELRLTTQIPKKIDVLSSQIDQRTKTIGNVVLQYCGINFNSDTRKMVQMLEVLQNFNSIQDLNYNEFLSFCKVYSKEYNEEVFEQVIAIRKYQKRTIAFLKEVLDFYKIPNNLMQYLSALSEYKHPTMEGIYETTQLS